MSSGGGSGGGGGTSFKNLIPGQEETMMDQACDACPKLTYKQRIMGFIGCGCFGYLIGFIGCLMLLNKNIPAFAVLFVLGNIIALAATMLLVGPYKQVKKMFDETRRIATCVYLSMLIIVFACGVTKQNIFLIIFLLIIMMLAGVWYAASYIPYGRKMIITCCKNTVCAPCKELFEGDKSGGGGGFGGSS